MNLEESVMYERIPTEETGPRIVGWHCTGDGPPEDSVFTLTYECPTCYAYISSDRQKAHLEWHSATDLPA